MSVPHATQHADANDAIEALEAKVGIGASTAITNSVLAGTAAGVSGWTTTPTLTSLTLTGKLFSSSATTIVPPAGGFTVANSADTIINFTASDTQTISRLGLTVQSGGLTVSAGGATFSAATDQAITVDQSTGDGTILDLRSTGDVAHGMTTLANTATYVSVAKLAGTDGGMYMQGFTDATRAVLLVGRAVTETTTKTTAGLGCVELTGSLKTGTTAGDMGADANLVIIRNNSTTRFIFDAEGSGHADVDWVAFDQHHDAALLDSFERIMRPDLERDPIKDSFGRVMSYDLAHLEDVGILGKGSYRIEPNGKARGMVNMTRLTMALTGNQYQMHQRLSVLEHAREIVQSHESRLERLERENTELRRLIGAGRAN